VVLGKTRMHELAVGVTTINMHGGPVLNPYDNTMHTGGLPLPTCKIAPLQGPTQRSNFIDCLVTSHHIAIVFVQKQLRPFENLDARSADGIRFKEMILCSGSSGGAAAAVAMRMGAAGFCSDTGTVHSCLTHAACCHLMYCCLEDSMMTSSTPRWSHTRLQLCFLDACGRHIMAGRIPGSHKGQRLSNQVCCSMDCAGGSCRIPAGMTGTVGFRPTTGCWNAGDGIVPMTVSRDTVGETLSACSHEQMHD